jgi:elongation factor P
MFEPNDLKKGVIFKYKNNPAAVVDFSHTHKGRGSATVTIKIRDLITQSVQTLTLKAGDKFEEADLARKTADFLYKTDTTAYFMETEQFEQLELPIKIIEEKLKFVKEGLEVTVINFEQKPIDIEIPPKVVLTVAETEPAVKGDTASGTAYKRARLETGLEILVPLFVKNNDLLRINTETGEYVERANS